MPYKWYLALSLCKALKTAKMTKKRPIIGRFFMPCCKKKQAFSKCHTN